jgi:hypothetical protein
VRRCDANVPDGVKRRALRGGNPAGNAAAALAGSAGPGVGSGPQRSRSVADAAPLTDAGGYSGRVLAVAASADLRARHGPIMAPKPLNNSHAEAGIGTVEFVKSKAGLPLNRYHVPSVSWDA